MVHNKFGEDIKTMITAKETANKYMETGVAKVSSSVPKLLISSFLAGAFIALGALGSQIAQTLIGGTAGKLAGACVFPVGLMMVVSLGVELFTGNCLLVIPLMSGRVRLSGVLRNWLFVWIGNFAGGLFVAFAAAWGHVFSPIEALTGSWSSVYDTAVAKASLSFSDAFLRGILCNIMVCMAVWMAMSASDAVGKLAAVFFPVMLFVLCGFEHSVANMYFIPSGFLVAAQHGAGEFTLYKLFANLIPVTIGNIVGGSVFVGLSVYYLFAKEL